MLDDFNLNLHVLLHPIRISTAGKNRHRTVVDCYSPITELYYISGDRALADIISDKICSKTNKNNQGQVTNLSEQVIAMGPGNEFTPKFKMDAHENTKINIYEDEDMNIHNNTAAV